MKKGIKSFSEKRLQTDYYFYNGNMYKETDSAGADEQVLAILQ